MPPTHTDGLLCQAGRLCALLRLPTPLSGAKFGCPLCWSIQCDLIRFIDPRVGKIRNEASSCPGIFSRTLRFYYVASSPGSPPPHLLDGHRKLVGSSTIPVKSCPGPVRYPWGSIVELEVPPDETPGLMTLHPHNTNVLQSIT